MEYRPMAQLPKGIDEMLRGYLECAEWCGLQDDDREALEHSVSPKWDAESLRQAGRGLRRIPGRESVRDRRQTLRGRA
jgi:hypothetical protein